MSFGNAEATGGTISLGSLPVSEGTRWLLDQVFLLSAASEDDPSGQALADGVLGDNPNSALLTARFALESANR
jgi:hypothetical protein